MRSFRTGAGLTNGHPTKFSCQRARYFSRSLVFTYSQYAFSEFQICACSLSEPPANAAAVTATIKPIVFNMGRYYYRPERTPFSTRRFDWFFRQLARDLNEPINAHSPIQQRNLAGPANRRGVRLFFGRSQSRFHYTAMVKFSDHHAPTD